MSALTWNETDPLPEQTTWLLEASAGTGKTYQIASLFLRLVAEYGVPVDRILAITFTNAATAELRDRIRARLSLALTMLRSTQQGPTGDGILNHVLSSGPAAAEVEKRLELALRTFDLAPISTIHGFSQRMLQEFAFDSGQDAELELLADASEVIERIVEDALATLFSQASAEELQLYVHAGMKRKRLVEVAHAMSGATRPTVSPAPTTDAAGQLKLAHEWNARARALLARWRSDEGRAALQALVEDVSPRRLLKTYRSNSIRPWIDSAAEWLASGTELLDSKAAWARWLHLDLIRDSWNGTPAELVTRPWMELITDLTSILNAHDQFWIDFSPVAAFAATARDKIETELERRRALTFDGMLSRLAERVEKDGGETSGIAERIRNRFDAVFVDEFQDTDDAQWRVIEAAFHRHKRLFLIGDPKQAIYAFRGADVHVYLKAADVVDDDQRRTMDRNWRSDPHAVAAMNTLFRAGSRAFDEAAFDYVEVKHKKPARLDPIRPGLDVRWVDARVTGGNDGERITKKTRALIARLAAREAAAWLNGQRSRIVDGSTTRDVRPADLAVLVNDRYEADAVRSALGRAGIPAVAAAKDSVFDSRVASWIVAWLEAVEGGGRDRGARTAVVTPLFGWTGNELAWALAVADHGDEATAEARAAGVDVESRDWNAWTERLRAAAERWAKYGFARTFDRELSEEGVLPRLLAMPEGERLATDLRHLFELLHVEDQTHRRGPGSLATWLRAQAEAAGQEAAQRLESDACAVRIETIHASKGLQYPIVLLPFAWSAQKDTDQDRPLVLRGGQQVELDVHLKGTPPRALAHARSAVEDRREALRKTYVALTRAEHATIVWYGPIGDDGAKASATPTGRLLLRAAGTPGFDDETMPDFKEPDAWASARSRLDELADRSKGTLTWAPETAPDRQPIAWRPPPQTPPAIETASWPEDRKSLGSQWIVTSYSGLAKGSAVHERDEKLSREETSAANETELHDGEESAENRISLTKPPLAVFANRPRLTLGRGTEYGTLVHEVFEHIDFTRGQAKDGRGTRDVVATAAGKVGLTDNAALLDEITRLLPEILATPLDSTAPNAPLQGLPKGFTLAHLATSDRLDELDFDLRLGDGTHWRRSGSRSAERGPASKTALFETLPGCVDPRQVYEAILGLKTARTHGMASWLSWLRGRRDAGKALIGSIAGILTGSIDLVFRTGRGASARYFVADYKTNRIEACEPGHFAGAWLDGEMAKAGYLLQSLIYTLALHRHLRSRLPGYDYDRHVGGYLYLFVRGMSGPDTPRDPATGHCLGVFGERWPKEVVAALDAALGPATGARS